jgi:hypothetical protein
LHEILKLEEVIVLEDLRMIERALDHRLRAGFAVAFEQVAFERTGIDNAAIAGRPVFLPQGR